MSYIYIYLVFMVPFLSIDKLKYSAHDSATQIYFSRSVAC